MTISPPINPMNPPNLTPTIKCLDATPFATPTASMFRHTAVRTPQSAISSMPPKPDPYATPMHRRIDAILFIVTFIVLAILLSTSARAASGTWIKLTGGGTATATGTWSVSTNWSGGSIADGVGATADFSTLNIKALSTITLDSNRTLGVLKIGDSSGTSNNYDIVSSLGATLTFDNGGSNAQINQTAGSAGDTVSAPILLKSSLDITNSASATLTIQTGGITSSAASGTQTVSLLSGNATITGVIGNGITGGTIAVSKSGSGTLTLNTATNTYSGGTFINSGTLSFNQSGSLGTGTVTLGTSGGGNATLQTTNSTSNPTNNIIVSSGSGGTLTIGSTSVSASGGNTYSGTVLLNGDLTVNSLFTGASGSSLKFSNAISGAGGIIKTGTGVATLSGTTDNTYGGTTTVTGGILDLSKTSSASIDAVSGNITIGDGATTAGLDVLRLAGSGGNQIADTSILTFNGTGTDAGTFRLNGQNETLGGLVSTGGAGVIEDNNAANSTLTVDVNTTNRDFSGVIQNGTGAGVLSLTKTGTASQTLSGTVANTYTGLTAVNSGTLILNKTAGVNAIAGNIKIGTGTAGSSAKVQLGASDQINNTSAVELAGGTFDLNGKSEGTATTGGAGVGALTLTATSTIDFGAGSTSLLHFAGLGAHTPSTGPDLAIINWNGVPNIGGGTERLLFTGSLSTFTSEFSQSDVSFNGITGYSAVQFGTFYEITAVPEPSTWAAGILTVLAIGWTQRRRFRKQPAFATVA